MADDEEEKRVARNVYEETHDLYRKMRAKIQVQEDLFYEVLYGPVLNEPKVVFVGVQPGAEKGGRFKEPTDAPQDMVLAQNPPPFPLAGRLQYAFRADPSLLSESTGLNAVFFRAPSWRAWCEMVPERKTRDKIEQSCVAMAKQLIGAIRPRLVVAIGFSALRLLGSRGEPLRPPKGGRVLLREGEVAGIPALAMHHPTPPARAPSNTEMEWIGSEILKRLDRPRGAPANG